MALRIWRGGSGYYAEVTPPHGKPWSNSAPLSNEELTEELQKVTRLGLLLYDAVSYADYAWRDEANSADELQVTPKGRNE